jgi:hypothetical protein
MHQACANSEDSISSIESINTSSSNPEDIVRPLGPFEEILWLLDQCASKHFAMAAEIEGTTMIEGWQAALDAVQKRHPSLSVCIKGKEGALLT